MRIGEKRDLMNQDDGGNKISRRRLGLVQHLEKGNRRGWSEGISGNHRVDIILVPRSSMAAQASRQRSAVGLSRSDCRTALGGAGGLMESNPHYVDNTEYATVDELETLFESPL